MRYVFLDGAKIFRADDLHRRTVAFVRAEAQAERVDRILPLLTEREAAWCLRPPRRQALSRRFRNRQFLREP